MAYSLLPFEDRGNFFKKWAQNVIRPFVNFREIWNEVYRGHSVFKPVVFGYFWYLFIIPVVLGVMYVAWSSIKAQVGHLYILYYSNLILILPGSIIGFIIGPFLFMFLGGIGAHGVLWILDEEARGGIKKTLRVFGYVIAWTTPIWALEFVIKIYIQMNPLRILAELDPLNKATSHNFSNIIFLLTFVLGIVSVVLMFILVVWGIRSIHRIAIWKSVVGVIFGFACFYLGQTIVQVYGNQMVVSMILGGSGSKNVDDKDEKNFNQEKINKNSDVAIKFRRFMKIIEKCHENVEKESRKAALPSPPRLVDLLTGGDWGAAIDLKQAQEGGFAPSCQVIYEQTVGALKGQIVYHAACLEEGPGSLVQGPPDPLLPPNWRASVDSVKSGMTLDRRASIKLIKDEFYGALLAVQSEIGPFESRPSVQVYSEEPSLLGEVVPQSKRTEQIISNAHQAPSRPLNTTYYGMNVKDLIKKAESGDNDAMQGLGNSLFFGYKRIEGMTDEQNKETGLKWMIKAYESGHRSSDNCLRIAIAYRNGWGTPADLSKFNLWNERARSLRADEEQALRDAEAKRRYNMR